MSVLQCWLKGEHVDPTPAGLSNGGWFFCSRCWRTVSGAAALPRAPTSGRLRLAIDHALAAAAAGGVLGSFSGFTGMVIGAVSTAVLSLATDWRAARRDAALPSLKTNDWDGLHDVRPATPEER
jgi:hypothetical protein